MAHVRVQQLMTSKNFSFDQQTLRSVLPEPKQLLYRDTKPISILRWQCCIILKAFEEINIFSVYIFFQMAVDMMQYCGHKTKLVYNIRTKVDPTFRIKSHPVKSFALIFLE